MFWSEIGKYERVELYAEVSVLARTLRGHLDDSDATAGAKRAREKALDEKPARHRHARDVALTLFARLESNGIDKRSFLSGLFENGGEHFCDARFPFRACNTDNDKSLRGESIGNRTETREKTMVEREQWFWSECRKDSLDSFQYLHVTCLRLS